MPLTPQEQAELQRLKAQYAQLQTQIQQEQTVNSPAYQQAFQKKAADRAFDLQDKASTLSESTPLLIKSLEDAKAASKMAPEGAFAGSKTWLNRNLGLLGLPGSKGYIDRAKAATDYNRITQENALTQLKSTFGGNPTEGERAILMGLSGSLNMSDAERQSLLSRTQDFAKIRQQVANMQAERAMAGNPMSAQEVYDTVDRMQKGLGGQQSAQPQAALQAQQPVAQQPMPQQMAQAQAQQQQGRIPMFNPQTGNFE